MFFVLLLPTPTNFKEKKMNKNTLNIALAIALSGLTLSANATAFAAPLVNFTINSPTVSGTTINPAQTPLSPAISVQSSYADSSNTNFHDTVSTHDVVHLAPTTTAPGVAYEYTDTKTTYDYVYSSYKYDYLTTSVATDPTKFDGNKYILITGSVTAAAATTINFGLTASGNYNSFTTPFGSTSPSLPSFYFGSTATNVSAVANTSYNTTPSNSTYSASSGYATPYDYYGSPISLVLAAGGTQNFAAYVFAGNDVSLSSFTLSESGGLYGLTTTTTPQIYTTSAFTGAHAIPVLAVPEPDTYGMMLMGLGLMGFTVLRRRNAQA